MKESLFIVGIFASGLVAGYLAGMNVEPAPVLTSERLPVNYDPQRALCNDMIKAADLRARECWASFVGQLERARHEHPSK